MESLIYKAIAIFFIIVTLGTMSVDLSLPNGKDFKYKSWY